MGILITFAAGIAVGVLLPLAFKPQLRAPKSTAARRARA